MSELEQLPINLDYRDRPTSWDVASIRSQGRRRRRRRRGLTAAAVCCVLLMVTLAFGAAQRMASAPAGASFAAGMPPADQALLLAHPPLVNKGVSPLPLPKSSGWTGRVWPTADGGFCLVAWSDGGGRHECLGTDVGPAGSVSVSSPTVDGVTDVRAVGLVRGPATSIAITRYGKTISATLVRLQTGDGSTLSFYYLPVPAEGQHPGLGWGTISALQAFDGSGRLVASWRTRPDPATP